MKIRIYDDSIRLRLDRKEVDEVGRGRAVASRTRFADGAEFGYRLTVMDAGSVHASFVDGCIEIALPEKVARQWAEDEAEISIRGENGLAEGALSLLIEKDFECLEPRAGESQENRFRNPKANR